MATELRKIADYAQGFGDGKNFIENSSRNYAKMVEEDRRLRLQGYELYRFGGAEFPDVDKSNDRFVVGPQAKKVVVDFFDCLFNRHKLRP